MTPEPYPESASEMPRYFFNLSDGDTIEDIDGESFDNLVDARDYAMRVADELAGGSATGKSISVSNEQGAVVFKTKIPEK